MYTNGSVINGKWEIVQRIGRGSHGTVYKAIDRTDNSQVAIKVEASEVRKKRLKDEHGIYRHMMGIIPQDLGHGVASPIYFEEKSDHKILVLELLGPSLLNLFNFQGCRFNLKTILMLFKGILLAIQKVHSTGVVHKDLKPANLCMGRGKNATSVHVIDYSVAKLYEDQDGAVNKFVGTTRYASASAHIGAAISRKDDLESICYVMMYLYKGRLPWSQQRNLSLAELNAYVREWKMKPLNEVCEEYPAFFKECLEYLRTIKFNDDPDYCLLIDIICKVMDKMNYVDDGLYEWFQRSDGSVIECSEENVNKRYDDIISYDQTPSPTPSNASNGTEKKQKQTEEDERSWGCENMKSESHEHEKSCIDGKSSVGMIDQPRTDECPIKTKDDRKHTSISSRRKMEKRHSFNVPSRPHLQGKVSSEDDDADENEDAKKKSVRGIRRIFDSLFKKNNQNKNNN